MNPLELCISVPVSFGADIETGDAVVECGTLRHITFDVK
jgi:hypothetical protein